MNDTAKKWLDDHSGCDFRKHVNEIRELDWDDSLPVVDEEMKLMGYALSHDDMLELERGQGQSWSSIGNLVAIEEEDALLAGLDWDDYATECWMIREEIGREKEDE